MNTRALVQMAREALAAGQSCVLCTVVRLDGSGYGRPGARLLITESGQRTGYVSGGCLEKDLCQRVWAATQSGPRLMAFDTRGNSVTPTPYNTGCEGVVYVLAQRISADATLPIDVLDCVDSERQPARMLTIYRTCSDKYRVGDMLIEMADQRFTSRDDLAIEESCERPWVTASRDSTLIFQDQEGCDVEAAIEVRMPPRELVLFGAGDDALPLVRSAAMLGWNVTVIGKRPELASRERFHAQNANEHVEVRCGDPATVCKRIEFHSRTDVVVMTHDFEGDVRLLPHLLRSPCRYIGLLGPKRRLALLVGRLFQDGYPLGSNEIARVRSPIGLDIGAVSPEEIAISIVAELIALERDREGGSLHLRQQPLHETCVPLRMPQPVLP